MKTRKGDVWWIAFSPQTGTEIHKPCRAVIATHEAGNANARVIQVLPLRMGQARVYPWEAPVTVKEELFTVLADQIATVNKTRLTAFVDHLSADDLRRVDVAMRKQLGL